METLNNSVPDVLSIRADQLTSLISKLNNDLVKICCALQLIETGEAYFTVKVLNKEDFAEVYELPVYWHDERIHFEPLVKERLLQVHAQLTRERSTADRDLHAIRRHLQSMAKDSTNSENRGDL